MATKTKATVRDVVWRTRDVLSVRVRPDETAPYKAGQWFFVTLPGTGDLRKPLSISSAPTETGYLELTKKLTSSEFSDRLSRLKAGDTILLQYPFGNFVYDGQFTRLAFCSGGIGITPIRSICKDLTDRKAAADLVLLYGNNTREDITFRDELEAMQKENPHLRITHILCKPDASWNGCTGFITEALVRKEIPDYLERQFYVCGPPAMVEALKKIVVALNIPEEHLVLENFAGYT